MINLIEKTEHKVRKIHCKVNAENPKMPFDEWFGVWLEEYKRLQVKIGTYETYRQYYKSLVKPALGEIPLCSIRCSDVQKLYNSLERKGYSLATVRLVAVLITGSLDRAVLNGVLNQNPARSAILPREKTPTKRYALTVEQQKLFFSYAEKSPLRSFFVVLMRTGLRCGELRGLKYCDIDKRNKVIHITRTVKYLPERGYFDDTPKTRSSIRDIPITGDLLDYLPVGAGGNNYIFRGRNPKSPLSRDRVQNEMTRIADEIRADGYDFPKITPHVLRHTFATRAIEAGMSPQTLKIILGHSSLAMTMDLYSHVMPDTRVSEMEKISAALV